MSDVPPSTMWGDEKKIHNSVHHGLVIFDRQTDNTWVGLYDASSSEGL